MEKSDRQTLKYAVNSFLTHMFYDYKRLRDKRNEKFTLLTYASGDKKRFAQCLSEGDASLLYDPYFHKEMDRLFSSCRGEKKFNEEWDIVIFNRTPISYKLTSQEERTTGWLQLATDSLSYRAAIKDFFVLGDNKNNIGLLAKDIVMDVVYACAEHVDELKKLNKKYDDLKKFPCALSLCKKVSFLRAKVTSLEAKITQRELLLENGFQKGIFLMNQLPDVRDAIYQDSCANRDEFYCSYLCPYRKKKNVCNILRMLWEQDYSCY